MFERIQKICNYLKKENDNTDIYINKEIKEKYNIYKKWLIENGAVFDKNIDFPFTYGPFHKIGCKSISDIDENEAIILMPKNLIIKSEDLQYFEQYIKDVIDDLYEDDLPAIYLTIYLYLEKQKQNSFYKPYIDILFLKDNNNDNSIYDKWDEKKITELNDEITIKSFEKILNKTEEIYNLIKQCDKFTNFTRNEFLNCYFQVMSKKLDLNDYNNNSVLIPILDLFYKDDSIKLRYEIYDSENMIFKYTTFLNDINNSKNNIQITKSKYLPINKPTYNKFIPLLVDYDDVEEDSEGKEKVKKIVKINNNDYFSLVLSKNEKISYSNIVCSNINDLCNKKIFKNKGFCLLYNRNDYLTVKFNINRGELLIDKYLEIIFGGKYQTKNDDPIYNTLKIKIEFNNISFDLLKYYRFMHFYEVKKNVKEYFKYRFNKDSEINIINKAIDFLKNRFKMMEINYSFDADLKDLENEIYKKDANYMRTNILIYRVSQKIILKNQIDLLSFILNIMIKYRKEITGYNSIFNFIDKEKYVNEYDKEEYTRMKILRFIAYMSKYIDLPYNN